MKFTNSIDHDHSKEGVKARLADGQKPNYLRDFVYGGIDGTVTTFAIVAGVAGASLPTGVLLILGASNLVADGFSMAASNYSGTKTEIDDYNRIRETERRHIRQFPEGEREEIRQILEDKGLSGSTLEEAVDAITDDEATWISMMMSDEYGMTAVLRDPMHSALATFVAFAICGLVPLLPFLLPIGQQFTWSAVATSAAFFAIGSVKSYWSLMSWWRSGFESLAIGVAAAGAAFLIGYMLRGLG